MVASLPLPLSARYSIADVNHDNEVNGADMVIVAENFGH